MNKLAITALLAASLFGIQAPAQAETDTSWTIILSGGDYRSGRYLPRPSRYPDHYYQRDHHRKPVHVHQHHYYYPRQAHRRDAWQQRHHDHGKYGHKKHGKFDRHHTRYDSHDRHERRSENHRDEKRGKAARWVARSNY